VKFDSLKFIFRIYACLCILVGLFHLIGIFYPINSTPVWRHALFVGINLFCAYGFVKRPRFFVYLFFLLALQQFYSHGGEAITIWSQQHLISSVDFAVVLFMLFAFVLLVVDKQERF
jgi:hypothetical protein